MHLPRRSSPFIHPSGKPKIDADQLRNAHDAQVHKRTVEPRVSSLRRGSTFQGRRGKSLRGHRPCGHRGRKWILARLSRFCCLRLIGSKPRVNMEHRRRIEAVVLSVHRRNGGTLAALDFSHRLLEPTLQLDSMDLAEIVAELERQDGWSPMDGRNRPATWGEYAVLLEGGRDRGEVGR